MPIPMQQPSAAPAPSGPPQGAAGAPPPPGAGPQKPPQGAALDQAIAAVGTGLQKITEVVGNSQAADDVKQGFQEALDKFAQAASALTGGSQGQPQSAPQGVDPNQGGGGPSQPPSQAMKGM